MPEPVDRQVLRHLRLALVQHVGYPDMLAPYEAVHAALSDHAWRPSWTTDEGLTVTWQGVRVFTGELMEKFQEMALITADDVSGRLDDILPLLVAQVVWHAEQMEWEDKPVYRDYSSTVSS